MDREINRYQWFYDWLNPDTGLWEKHTSWLDEGEHIKNYWKNVRNVSCQFGYTYTLINYNSI